MYLPLHILRPRVSVLGTGLFYSSFVYDEQKFHEVLGSLTVWILYMAQVLTIGVHCSLGYLSLFEL